MFEVNNGIAKIDGTKGLYDDKNVTNPSDRYGRNAADNYFSYLENPLATEMINPNYKPQTAPILNFSPTEEAAQENAEKIEKFIDDNQKYLNALPPLEFEYRYMPNIHRRGEIDKKALLGAAYEEMGQKNELDVNEVNKSFAGVNGQEEFTSAPIDINGDGKIDVGEYSTTILAADMYSKSDNPTPDDIDGTINSKGLNKVMEYTKKSNAIAAANLYSNLYNKYNLGNP